MTREEEIKKQAEKKALEPSRLMHPYAKQYKVMSAYEIGYIEGAVWADAHPHWISVEDKLPKEKGWIILSTVQNSIACPCLYYENDGKEELVSQGITHWMPLPQKLSSSEKPNNCEEGGEE